MSIAPEFLRPVGSDVKATQKKRSSARGERKASAQALGASSPAEENFLPLLVPLDLHQRDACAQAKRIGYAVFPSSQAADRTLPMYIWSERLVLRSGGGRALSTCASLHEHKPTSGLPLTLQVKLRLRMGHHSSSRLSPYSTRIRLDGPFRFIQRDLLRSSGVITSSIPC